MTLIDTFARAGRWAHTLAALLCSALVLATPFAAIA
jgi:hypothetical protein